jgi:hypothetical protein
MIIYGEAEKTCNLDRDPGICCRLLNLPKGI